MCHNAPLTYFFHKNWAADIRANPPLQFKGSSLTRNVHTDTEPMPSTLATMPLEATGAGDHSGGLYPRLLSFAHVYIDPIVHWYIYSARCYDIWQLSGPLCFGVHVGYC